MQIRSTRKDFEEGMLLEKDCPDNPFHLFEEWLTAALIMDKDHANAMTLCTIDQDGMPDCRTVLLRNISYSGFTFFTNYRSAKARQIERHAKACVLFFWKELQRQVKVRGEIRFLPPGDSDAYFASRPFESQVGAWASHQSEVVADRKTLDDAFSRELKAYRGKTVPRPPHWGGYVLLPDSFEFWQGRRSRLHDRLRFTRNSQKGWRIERLMP